MAATARSILETVVSQGTGTNAATGDSPEWGKTGTTENNGDAWFVGATQDITVAVWVGHANSVKPMVTEFGGAPVDGGTIPALIFHDVVLAYEQSEPRQGDRRGTDAPATPTTPAPRARAAPAPDDAGPPPRPGDARRAAAAAAAAAPAAASGGGAGRHRRRRLARLALAQLAQRPREVLAAGGAEAPGKLGGAGDADSGPGRDRDLRASRRRGRAARRGAR